MYVVSRKFVHPDYHFDGFRPPRNDLAILELEESVEFSDSIKPACIANYNNVEIDTKTGTVITSGWGSTVECRKQSSCTTPDILQGTEMFLLSRKLCNKHVNEGLGEKIEDLITDVMICANDHSRVCYGDSGGNDFSYICPAAVP